MLIVHGFIQVTGFFPHLTHLLRELIQLHVITCHHVHHPNGWYCKLVVNPGVPLK